MTCYIYSPFNYQLPLLNAVSPDHIPSGTLVRFHGMIQDQFDPEFYLKTFSIINRETGEKDNCCGMYTDSIDLKPGFEVDYDSSDNITDDRQTLYVVPIPGETPWVKHLTKQDHGEGQYGILSEGMSVETNRSKRSLDEVEEENDDEMEVERNDIAVRCNKRKKDEQSNQSQKDIPISLNHPLPGETRSPCMVKVYCDSQLFPVNGVFEFIGILSSDPSLVNFEPGVPEQNILDPFVSETSAERHVHCPPPSLIPRLHCILATPLSHSNPTLPITLAPPITKQDLIDAGCDVKTCRENLLDLLTTVLMGDHFAAEYMLLHLLSSVYGRTDVMTLGKFSLNLSNCPVFDHTPFPSLVNELIEQLVTKSYLLSLSLTNLNTSQFLPQKDYNANRLKTGLLQLSSGTHLIVNEMAMGPGQLGERGVANLTALGGVVQWQKVKYDFKYHTQEFECNLPVLILSEGKSIVNVDCHVPLQHSSSSAFINPFSLVAEYSQEAILHMRQYLTLCTMLQYSLDKDIEKKLQEDFVQMRRSDPQMNGDTFHHLLSLSRLLTLSHGEQKLSLEYWNRAKKLHYLRITRLK